MKTLTELSVLFVAQTNDFEMILWKKLGVMVKFLWIKMPSMEHSFVRTTWLAGGGCARPIAGQSRSMTPPLSFTLYGLCVFSFHGVVFAFYYFFGGLVSDWLIYVVVGGISCFAVKLEMPWNTLDFPDFLCLDIFPAAERAVYPILLYFNVF